MAVERFTFWEGYADACELLGSDERIGRFVRGLYRYAFGKFESSEPDFSDDPTMQMAWAVVRDQVSESVAIGHRMSAMGKRSGESRRAKSKVAANDVEHSSEPSSERKVSKVRNGKVTRSLPERDASRNPSSSDGVALAPRDDRDDDALWEGDST